MRHRWSHCSRARARRVAPHVRDCWRIRQGRGAVRCATDYTTDGATAPRRTDRSVARRRAAGDRDTRAASVAVASWGMGKLPPRVAICFERAQARVQPTTSTSRRWWRPRGTTPSSWASGGGPRSIRQFLGVITDFTRLAKEGVVLLYVSEERKARLDGGRARAWRRVGCPGDG